MFHLRGSTWGPSPLPDFLREQLDAHGFSPDDAGRCARLIGEQPSGSSAASSLFVDLGSCKFLEADIDGAIAAWRHAITSDHDAAATRSLLNLGLLHEHLHLHDRALGLLARVVERDVAPYVVPAAMASARCQVAIGDDERAMETMARLAQRVMATGAQGAELSHALYGLGDIAVHAGRPDRAERAWRAAMAGGTPEIQQAAMERLVRLLLAGGQDRAVLDLLATGSLAAHDADPVFLDTAEHFLQRDEPNLAADVLAVVQGAHCKPADRFRLADAKMRCGQVNEAIDELEALLADPDEQVQVRALFSLGEVYAVHDMVDPAISMFQRVVAADDEYWSPVGSLALGDLEAMSGDHDAASEHWTYAAGGGVARVADDAQGRLDDQSESVDADMALVPAVAPDAADAANAHMTSLESPEVDHDFIDMTEPVAILPAAALPATTLPAAEVPESKPAKPQVVPLEATDIAGGSGANDADRADEPIVVVLDTLEPAAAQANTPSDGDLGDPLTVDEAADGGPNQPEAASPSIERPASSVFSSHVDDANPYAALAPEHDTNDVSPTTRNPYAELAPNFDDVELPPDVEPGDWESMLEDWSPDEPSSKPHKRSSAFSRYT